MKKYLIQIFYRRTERQSYMIHLLAVTKKANKTGNIKKNKVLTNVIQAWNLMLKKDISSIEEKGSLGSFDRVISDSTINRFFKKILVKARSSLVKIMANRPILNENCLWTKCLNIMKQETTNEWNKLLREVSEQTILQYQLESRV
ncbi:hypothetical protein BpHYR1_035407 [Brachionus plicatilis]|uniref:Uncharacterized protein n=1 Tax=Brachionus plicatilis TaxID=10195 RepID=A0A3M7QGY3_BRAPC|nr:hypothetical protein BpHYR1_035407 [Brachionus plicatilis]